MSILDAIILGALQGLTEFLPVSSSGHLVLAQELLGIKQPGVSFEVVVHLGTLLSVVVYFRVRLSRLISSLWMPKARAEKKKILLLLLGTLPAGVIGILFKDYFEAAFSSPVMTSGMLILTGFILLSSRLTPAKGCQLKPGGALMIGLAQATAILPGISRSGSTIVAGMWYGLPPEEAAEYSFLLAIPAIGGAALLNVRELLDLAATDVMVYSLGAAVSFGFGLAAVYLVLRLIRLRRFDIFAYYCFAAGSVGLYLFI